MRIRNDVVISKNKTSQNKPWLVRWWGKFDLDKESQPRHSKSFTTKKPAEVFAQSLKDDIEDGISTEPQKITLGKLFEKFLKIKKKDIAPSTYRCYRNSVDRLNNYFGSHRAIKSIKVKDAEEFMSEIKLLTKSKDASDSTRAKQLRNSKLIFNKALEWDYIKKNPFKTLKIGKIEKEDWFCIEPVHFNALLNVIKTREGLEIDKKIELTAFYSIMYGCGLRFGEAVHLFWDNIDFKESRIDLANRTTRNGLPPFTLKDYESRSIPCPVWVVESLKQLKELSNTDNPYVFITDQRYEHIKNLWQKMVTDGDSDRWRNNFMVRNCNRTFRYYCSKAGIETSDRLSLHCFRKGYGTNLANLGTPVHTLKELMGHSSIETTMKFYLKCSDANKVKAIEGLNKLVG